MVEHKATIGDLAKTASLGLMKKKSNSIESKMALV